MEYTASMTIDATSIPWDAIIFGKESEFPLYIYKSDLMEIIYGIEDLNVSILQL